jgi:hypothetical protein
MNTIMQIAQNYVCLNAIVSKLNTKIKQKLRSTPFHTYEPQTRQIWTIFSYHNPQIRKVTKLFKNTNVKATLISFSTTYITLIP